MRKWKTEPNGNITMTFAQVDAVMEEVEPEIYDDTIFLSAHESLIHNLSSEAEEELQVYVKTDSITFNPTMLPQILEIQKGVGFMSHFSNDEIVDQVSHFLEIIHQLIKYTVVG